MLSKQEFKYVLPKESIQSINIMKVLSRDNPEEYKNAFRAVKTILQKDGSKAFFKGIGARILWIGMLYLPAE